MTYYKEMNHNGNPIDAIKTETGEITVGNTYEGCYFMKCTEEEYTSFKAATPKCLGNVAESCDNCNKCPF